MLIDERSDCIDLGEFVAPEKGLDRCNWQCAYLEQYLNDDGTQKICDLYSAPSPAVQPCRIAFFIYKFDTQDGTLLSPYGELSLANAKPLPARLKDIIIFHDEEDEDDEDDED